MTLLLAAGGLYGTLLYVAGQRRRETGIRLALGASPSHVEGLVIRSGIAIGAAGVTPGLFGAWGAGRLLQSRIRDVEPDDPLTLAARRRCSWPRRSSRVGSPRGVPAEATPW